GVLLQEGLVVLGDAFERSEGAPDLGEGVEVGEAERLRLFEPMEAAQEVREIRDGPVLLAVLSALPVRDHSAVDRQRLPDAGQYARGREVLLRQPPRDAD